MTLENPSPRLCSIFYWLVIDHAYTPERCGKVINQFADDIDKRATWHARPLAKLLVSLESKT